MSVLSTSKHYKQVLYTQCIWQNIKHHIDHQNINNYQNKTNFWFYINKNRWQGYTSDIWNHTYGKISNCGA